MPLLVLSQNQDNTIISIEEIYNHMIINEVSGAKQFISPSSNYTLSNKDQSILILNSEKVKNIISDFKNDWVYLIFNEISIKEIDSENILVTGLLSGKNIEKGMINYQKFQHTWLLENGIVVKFRE
jgi:hypothetical protein